LRRDVGCHRHAGRAGGWRRARHGRRHGCQPAALQR
jgi:hypothetical protein